MDAQMGSTGGGFLGLARGMAEYLVYKNHKIEKHSQDHWKYIVTYQTIEHSPIQREKKTLSF